MKPIDVHKYRPLKRRRSKTLLRWWGELNCWGWVPEFGAIEKKVNWDGGARERAMQLIEKELGIRCCVKDVAP